MMFKNTLITYGIGTRLLHWIMAALIIGLLAIGFYMTNIDKSDSKWYLYSLHKATGTLVLGLIVLRIIWRFSNIWPGLPDNTPKWQANLAHFNIFFLYCMMLLMPITGFFGSIVGGHDISFYGLFTIPAIANDKDTSKLLFEIHEIAPYFLIASIGLHLFAAFYHHFIMKDNVLLRMIKGS